MGDSDEARAAFEDFAMSHNMRVANSYYEKAERHKITYKSGSAESQIGYILCRSSDKGNIKDGKVILGESVTNQHRPLVWWTLAEPDLKEQFTEASRKVILHRDR